MPFSSIVAFARVIKTNTTVSEAVLYEQAVQAITATGGWLCVSQPPITSTGIPQESRAFQTGLWEWVLSCKMKWGDRICLTRQRACLQAPEIPKGVPGSWLIHLCPCTSTSIILSFSIFIGFAATLKNMWLNILCHLTFGIIYLSFTSFLLWFSISSSLSSEIVTILSSCPG